MGSIPCDSESCVCAWKLDMFMVLNQAFILTFQDYFSLMCNLTWIFYCNSFIVLIYNWKVSFFYLLCSKAWPFAALNIILSVNKIVLVNRKREMQFWQKLRFLKHIWSCWSELMCSMMHSPSVRKENLVQLTIFDLDDFLKFR